MKLTDRFVGLSSGKTYVVIGYYNLIPILKNLTSKRALHLKALSVNKACVLHNVL